MMNISQDIYSWASTHGMTFANPFFIMIALFALAGCILGFPFLRKLFFRSKRSDPAKSEREMLE